MTKPSNQEKLNDLYDEDVCLFEKIAYLKIY